MSVDLGDTELMLWVLEMHADVDGDALRHFVDTTQKLAPGSKAVPIATAAGGVPHGTRGRVLVCSPKRA